MCVCVCIYNVFNIIVTFLYLFDILISTYGYPYFIFTLKNRYEF